MKNEELQKLKQLDRIEYMLEKQDKVPDSIVILGAIVVAIGFIVPKVFIICSLCYIIIQIIWFIQLYKFYKYADKKYLKR